MGVDLRCVSYGDHEKQIGPRPGLLNGGNSSPHGVKLAPPGEWLARAARFYDASLAVPARDPQLILRIGEITALEVRVTGLDWAFSPTAAVARDPRWGCCAACAPRRCRWLTWEDDGELQPPP